MQRRNFIKNAGLATAGAFLVPHILPSGSLFASTGARKANHVVFCLFAGGVRNLESMQMQDGNLMPFTLAGTQSVSSDIAGGMTTLPSPTGTPLQTFGTLFKEFRYAQGPTGHYNGHTAAVTGNYTATDLNIKDNPTNPTIFEYYRKHNSPAKSALNSWWISNMLGPYPALNYSKSLEYGALYGANFMQPLSMLNFNGQAGSFNGVDLLSSFKNFRSADMDASAKLRGFSDQNFLKQYDMNAAGPFNPKTDAESLDAFIHNVFVEAQAGVYNNPWSISGGMSSDMYNVYFAEKVLTNYKPELLVMNMQDADICHSNFTSYCNNIRKADYALAHLWNTIQSTPGLANDTILIVAPEHGRNLKPNTIVDAYGRAALDHTSDDTSREIFCLVAGPPGVVKQNTVISSVAGETIDIVPTIANILGFEKDIPLAYRSNMGEVLAQAFV